MPLYYTYFVVHILRSVYINVLRDLSHDASRLLAPEALGFIGIEKHINTVSTY
jgi:hypothetical protein